MWNKIQFNKRFRYRRSIDISRYILACYAALIIAFMKITKQAYSEIFPIFELNQETNQTKNLIIAKQYCGDISAMLNPSLAEKAKQNAKKLDKCSYCAVNRPDPNSTSTVNDAAFAFLTGNQSANLLTWVRTLRSTGCKCSIILLMTEEFYESHHSSVIKDLENCGATIVNVSYFNHFRIRDGRVFSRLIFHLFLEYQSHNFDRIMINDIFDTIFQKDPFNKQMPSDKLSFSIERSVFSHNYYNQGYLYNAIGINAFSAEWSNRFVVNSGFVIGPGDMMNKFHKIIVEYDTFLTDIVMDQSFYNDIIYHKKFREIFVDFNATLYASAAYSVYELHPRSDGFLYDWDTKTAPAVIHQADRVCPAHSYVNEFCPSTNEHYKISLRPKYILQKCDQLKNPSDRAVIDSRSATIS